MKKLIFLLLIVFVTTNCLICAEIQTSIDTSKTELDNLYIGDQIYFNVFIKHNQKQQAFLEQKNQSEIFNILSSRKQILDQGTEFKFTAAFFDTGPQKIPAQEFKILGDSDSLTVYSDSLQVQVKSTLTTQDSSQLKDIFAPVSLHLSFWDIFLPLIILAAIVLIIILVVRHKKGKPIIKTGKKPQVPAHVTALKKLDRLKLSNLLSQGKIKEFYVRLSWICREYLENRYNLPILESTNLEIKQELKQAGVETAAKFHNFLRKCDRVKYAKHLPTISQAEPLLEELEKLIMKTKPIVEENSEVSSKND